MLAWILARLREPSTHATVASFLAAVGLTQLDPGAVRDVLIGVAALCGALGIGLREKGGA